MDFRGEIDFLKAPAPGPWGEAVAYAHEFLSAASILPDRIPVDGNLEMRYRAMSAWRPQEIPDADFAPDFSIQLDGEAVKGFIKEAFPRVIDIGGGRLDATATGETKISLGCKKSESCQWTQHLLSINLLSMGDKARPTIIQWNGQVIPLDSFGLSIVPTPRITGGVINIDCAAEIDWIQDRDWPAWVLIATNEYVRSKINPGLPRPVFSAPLQGVEIPANAGIAKSALRIVGCPYSVNGPVAQSIYVDLKFS